jgi:iron complex transport system substrate-binding protein
MMDGALPVPRSAGVARVLLAVVAGAVAVAAAGCAGNHPSSASKAAAADTSPVRVRSCGRPVMSEGVPKQVVATAVGLTDTLYALGVGDRLIGVGSTDYAKPSPQYAAAFSKVPSLGKTGTGAKELVLSKQPDLVYAEDKTYPFDAKSGRATIAELEAAGAAVYVSAQGCDEAQGLLAGVYSDVENLGALLRVSDNSDALVTDLRKRVADVKGLLAGRRMKVAILGTGEPTCTRSVRRTPKERC